MYSGSRSLEVEEEANVCREEGFRGFEVFWNLHGEVCLWLPRLPRPNEPGLCSAKRPFFAPPRIEMLQSSSQTAVHGHNFSPEDGG